jgi:hypothetical protein
MINRTEHTARANELFQNLLIKTRQRMKEEEARLEDQAANDTDASRARNLRTLAPIDGITIDPTRQVSAKDFFDLELSHTSGQRIDCRVEVLLRDKPHDKSDGGDVLICEVDTQSRWLLFPPIELDRISARPGAAKGELVVMITGVQGSQIWRELFVLTSVDEDTATEWLQMLGSHPEPPSLQHATDRSTQQYPRVRPTVSAAVNPYAEEDISSLPSQPEGETDVPIGERRMVLKNTPKGGSRNKQNLAFIRTESSSTPAARRPATGEAAHDPDMPSSQSPHAAKYAKAPQTETIEVNDSPPLDSLLRNNVPLTTDTKNPSPRTHSTRQDGAPQPPPHRTPSPSTVNKTLLPHAITPTSKSRRLSSPLKHEYQPSNASYTSFSSSTDSESEDYSDSSEEELEAVDLPVSRPAPRGLNKGGSPAGSIFSLLVGSLAPSNSASQAPYRGVFPQAGAKKTTLVATISCWSHRGHWVDLNPEECSIVVSPGLVEAFSEKAFNSADVDEKDHLLSSTPSEMNSDIDAGAKRPLVALELTPIVPLRQSNALDIEIRSPPTARSSVKCTHTVRFRSRNLQECSALYSAIHTARLENPVYKKLEQERIVNCYGKQVYQDVTGANRRRSWFGRSKSYRASARAPSVTVSDNSMNSFASAISRLRNMGGIGGFNIARSSMGTSRGGPATSSGSTSVYTRSSRSTTSGNTPPQTPRSPSISMTGTSNVASLGASDLRIRLYLLETSSRWNELGNAFLTVVHPPRGMRQASSLYNGTEKRVIVIKKQGTKHTLNDKVTGSGSPRGEGHENAQVLLDVVLGAGCFSRLGVVGIAVNVWEDVVGDNGQIGTVGAVGGVSGRTRKWLFQCASAAEATWIFALVGGGTR